MSEKYIRIQDAVDALAKTMPTPATPDGAGEFDHEIHIADEAFADAIRIIESLKPADVVPYSIATDGTATITVPKGTYKKINRVLVQEDGTHCGGLYYAD